jgi:hypothetical protein
MPTRGVRRDERSQRVIDALRRARETNTETETNLPFGINLPTNQDEDYYRDHRNFQPGSDLWYEALNYNPVNNYVRQEDGTWVNQPINVFTENPEYWQWEEEHPDEPSDYYHGRNPDHPDNPYELYIPDPDDLGLGQGGQGVRPPPRTDYIPTSTPPPTGIAPPRVNMPTPPGTGGGGSPPGGPFPGMNTPPPGQISGPSRIFSPFGEPMGVFSAPRTYGGLPRSTGPWGIPGGWYEGQEAQANALRGRGNA